MYVCMYIYVQRQEHIMWKGAIQKCHYNNYYHYYYIILLQGAIRDQRVGPLAALIISGTPTDNNNS